MKNCEILEIFQIVVVGHPLTVIMITLMMEIPNMKAEHHGLIASLTHAPEGTVTWIKI